MWFLEGDEVGESLIDQGEGLPSGAAEAFGEIGGEGTYGSHIRVSASQYRRFAEYRLRSMGWGERLSTG